MRQCSGDLYSERTVGRRSGLIGMLGDLVETKCQDAKAEEQRRWQRD